MNKSEFIAYIAERTGTSKKEATYTVNVIFDSIEDIISTGGSVTINGFGEFGIKDRAARVSPDIKKIKNKADDGKLLSIPAAKKVYFKVGNTLKKRVAAEFEKSEN